MATPTPTPVVATGRRIHLIPGATNQDKIELYDSWALERRTEEHQRDIGCAMKWYVDPTATYNGALALLDQVPPVRPGGHGTATKSVSKKEQRLRPLRKVISDPEWLEENIAWRQPSDGASHHGFGAAMPVSFRASLLPDLTSDRRKPSQAETSENITDTFHLNFILTPATRIAAAMRNEQSLSAGFAASQNSTKGDLMVFTPLSSVDDKRTPWITVEDKRLEVFTAHCDEFCSYASQARFP
ncbi:hypothetical protein FB451DRAFT_426631 [Mycena latifolia]|nr:hypothetical protein FB451DRAFT_426631 [Mycena latifolia]